MQKGENTQVTLSPDDFYATLTREELLEEIEHLRTLLSVYLDNLRTPREGRNTAA